MIKAKTRAMGGARDARTGAEPVATEKASGQPRPERARAADYLDLWERQVSDAAVRGKGVSAPWFAR